MSPDASTTSFRSFAIDIKNPEPVIGSGLSYSRRTVNGSQSISIARQPFHAMADVYSAATRRQAYWRPCAFPIYARARSIRARTRSLPTSAITASMAGDWPRPVTATQRHADFAHALTQLGGGRFNQLVQRLGSPGQGRQLGFGQSQRLGSHTAQVLLGSGFVDGFVLFWNGRLWAAISTRVLQRSASRVTTSASAGPLLVSICCWFHVPGQMLVHRPDPGCACSGCSATRACRC